MFLFPEYFTIVLVLSILLTCFAMVYTIFRKRNNVFDPRVKLFLQGVLSTWIGTLFYVIGMINFASFFLVAGSLITIQILMEWKYGRYVWLKAFSIILFLGIIVVPLISLL